VEAPARTREVLAEVSTRVDGGALLWRGADLSGGDVDLLVLPHAELELTDLLSRRGLSPHPRPGGRTVWSAREAGARPIDVVPASEWRPYYPSLDAVLDRANRPEGLPPVASPEDQLLVRAAELVAGRPLVKALPRIRRLLAEPGARERLMRIADEQGAQPLAELVSDPHRLAARAARGRLPYRACLTAGARSPAARSALVDRVRRRLAAAAPSPPLVLSPARRPPGALIAISGMDGAGKSTAALKLRARLEQLGRPAEVSWGRLAAELGGLERIAEGVKRLLRRTGSVADPVAAGSPEAENRGQRPRPAGRPQLVGWVWILLVALKNARYLRRATAPRRRGKTVVCDRSVVDSLVDFRLRYGRHPVAEAVLTRLAPRPDLGIWLRLDAGTAARRGDGDQALRVLRDMERRYALVAPRHGYVEVDATPPVGEVQRVLDELVSAAVGGGAGRGGATPAPAAPSSAGPR
jgi:thymidylate kinase